MTWTARIDVAPLKHFIVVSGVALSWLFISLLVGFLGPSVMVSEQFSTFRCIDRNHFLFTNESCSGTQPALGQWSPLMQLATDQLNRHWIATVTPYTLPGTNGVWDDIRIDVIIAGRDPQFVWHTLTNKTERSFLPCPSGRSKCPSFVLVYESNILYPQYSLQVRWADRNGQPLAPLGDVEYTVSKDNSSFSKIFLVMRVSYLAIAVAALCYHLLSLRGEKIHFDAWTLEHRLLLCLLVGLILFNNPLYALVYVVPGWFFTFFDAFLELLFVCLLFLFWFFAITKMKSESGELILTVLMRLKIVGVGCYALTSTILYGWVAIRDQTSPLFSISTHVSGVQALFYVQSVIYLLLVLGFFSDIFFAWGTIQTQPQLKYQVLYFTIPSLVVITSVLVGIILGVVGPFSRESPAALYFNSLYNAFVLYLLWAYWPIERSLGAGTQVQVSDAGETTKIFGDALEKKTYSTL